MKLSEFILNNRLYLDGAMGSRLIECGLATERAELYSVTAPDVIKKIHTQYLEAGSRMIYANTFGCNGYKYSKDELKQIIPASVGIARECADRYNAYAAYSAGPLNELLRPFGKLSFDEAYALYKEQADKIKNLPLDAVVIETVTDVLMAKAAILAFKENTSFPVWCSMSFEENGRAFTGASAGSFALIAAGLNADAIGINCSVGPDKMLNAVRQLIKYARVPLFVKPNAGMPVFKNGKTGYDIDAAEFAAYMKDIAAEGVSILGGCCGTDADYIGQTIKATKAMPFKLFDNRADALCSASKIVEIKPTLVIGERINPTGKPLLKQALTSGDYDYIAALAVEQSDAGAQLLDINVGMPGIDESEKMAETVEKVQAVTDLPLSIDSSRLSALERGLRLTGGIALINSVNGDDEVLSSVLPLAKKYGAYVVGLCLDKKGIPTDAEGRVRIAERIIARAEEYGIGRERLFIDALTMAVSVDRDNALITLETVKRLSAMGVKTILGLSNVSFGLPAREVVNASFYQMTKDSGVTALIINPKLKPKTDDLAVNALLGKDGNCAAYVAAYSGFKAEEKPSDEISIAECVVKGLKSECLAKLKGIVTADNYMTLIDGHIIAGLKTLGEAYEQGRAFLPQLIAGAECAKAALNALRMYMPENAAVKAVMLIATVKGDVHDIGKNIVKTVLANYGFKIIDLGRDVSTDEVMDAVDKHNPQIVGLSALMTTTLDNMADTARTIKERHRDIIVMVGGAVVTPTFAAQIGAIYSKDAQEAAVILNKMFK